MQVWGSYDTIFSQSLSLRRAWIEMRSGGMSALFVKSLSLRRAWIEITRLQAIDDTHKSLSLRRAWIEITWSPPLLFGTHCRSPYGERGLK